MAIMYHSEDAHLRLLGATAGVGVATAVLAIAAVTDVFRNEPPIATLVLPTVLAGLIGGAVMATRTVHSSWIATRWSRFTLRLRVAAIAVAVGAFVIAAEWGINGYFDADPNGTLTHLLIGVPALAALGILLAGPFVLPVTFAAAVVWTWLMRRFMAAG